MSSFLIEGGYEISGQINVSGSKNAALPLIAATLLTKQKCTLNNIPDIEDVKTMLLILEKMGSHIEQKQSTVIIENKDINPININTSNLKKLRASILLIGPLLARFGKINLGHPGGDPIGKRSIETHINAFRELGCFVKQNDKKIEIERKNKKLPSSITLNDFSVTATENVLMFLAGTNSKTEIFMIAEEPSVQNLQIMLKKMGAEVNFLPYHHLFVKGSDSLRGAKINTFFDPIEAGTFVAMALANKGDVKINNFPYNDLRFVIHFLLNSNANIDIESENSIRVRKSPDLKLKKIQTMLYPGFPTDLQSPFGVLATQTKGITMIHDPLFEGRLKYLEDLKKMGANIDIIDDHRAKITGITPLRGMVVKGEDIRGAMSIIIAGMVAKGETTIENAVQVDRGYESIETRLQAIGAKIKRF